MSYNTDTIEIEINEKIKEVEIKNISKIKTVFHWED